MEADAVFGSLRSATVTPQRRSRRCGVSDSIARPSRALAELSPSVAHGGSVCRAPDCHQTVAEQIRRHAICLTARSLALRDWEFLCGLTALSLEELAVGGPVARPVASVRRRRYSNRPPYVSRRATPARLGWEAHWLSCGDVRYPGTSRTPSLLLFMSGDWGLPSGVAHSAWRSAAVWVRAAWMPGMAATRLPRMRAPMATMAMVRVGTVGSGTT